MMSLRKEMKDMLLIAVCAALLGVVALFGKPSYEAASNYANTLIK